MTHIQNFYLLCSEEKKGFFNDQFMQEAIENNFNRMKALSTTRVRLMIEKGQADIYDELNNEVYLKKNQYFELLEHLPEL